MREYECELDEELNSVLNKYIEDEYEYQELCVQIFEKAIKDDPETELLLNTFESIGANNLEAKIKLAEFMIAGM